VDNLKNTVPSAAAEVKVGDAAQEYAELGWHVFPCHWPIFASNGGVRCSCGKAACIAARQIGKHPRTPNGHLDATTDRDRIDRYWSRWPLANIGVPTGAANGITVLDIDPRNGGDHSLIVLEQQHEPLPPTARNRTGSGGEHILFAHIPGVRNSASKLGAGIDVRGDGGYVVMPPSLHKSGNRYEITCGLPIAAAPDWLVKKLVSGQHRGPAPPEYWRELFEAGAPLGTRDTTLIKMTGYLLRRGLDPLLVLDIVQMWNRERFQPPLSEEQVARDVRSICRSELRKMKGAA
jgi:hypothetical protein